MKLLRRCFLRLAAVAAAFSTSALRLALAVEFRIRPVRIVVPNEGHLGNIQKLDSLRGGLVRNRPTGRRSNRGIRVQLGWECPHRGLASFRNYYRFYPTILAPEF